MEEAEQYFAYLFTKWREEQEKDMKKTVGEVQDAVLHDWLKRGGGEGGEIRVEVAKKKEKKTLDPDEPKKPLSSFMIFLAEQKDEVKREQPSLGPKDVSREVGRRWGLLEREEKQVYQERYNSMLLAYKEDLATYRVRKEAQSAAEAVDTVGSS